MKTIKDDRKRKLHFDAIVENYINDNITDCKTSISKLSKLDLIRFVNYLHYFVGSLYLDVNGAGELNLFETR